jgi:hypothetical protein
MTAMSSLTEAIPKRKRLPVLSAGSLSSLSAVILCQCSGLMGRNSYLSSKQIDIPSDSDRTTVPFSSI